MTIVDSPTIRVERDEPLERHTSLTILCANSVGSSEFSGQDHKDAPQETVDWSNQLVSASIHKHQGQVIKAIGGSVMAEFSDPAFAVRAAIEMERELAESNRTLASYAQPGLRIGIHGVAGNGQGMDVFGDAVQVAGNIMKHAASGQILISREVCDAISDEMDLHSQWVRKVPMDGRRQNEDVFEVHWIEFSASIPSRYEVLSQVGTGGMGIVYKVRDRETDDVIALKMLKTEIASDPLMQENLRREVSLARKVTHKNVCRIYEFNRSSGTAYVSMEFVEGESLLSRLHRNGPLPWNEALQIGRQICSGLREAHVQGIVHRDLKPANIMVDRSGWVKIMDFGIARLFQGAAHMTGTLVGTPAYMAPEQVELKRVDGRTDVYALGLLLYEIVTGSPVFEGDTPIALAVKQLREIPKSPREIMPALPAHAEAVILKCLQKDPAKRFQSVDELAAALKRESRSKSTASLWASFVADFRCSARHLHGSLQANLAQISAFLRRQNWRTLTQKRARMVLAGVFGVACLLCGLLVFSARSSAQNHVSDSSPVNASAAIAIPGAGSPGDAWRSSSEHEQTTAQTLQPSVEGRPLPNDLSPVRSYEVDLGSASGSASEKITLASEGSTRQPPSDPKTSRAEQKTKAQVSARAAAPSVPARRLTPPLAATQATLPESGIAASAASSNDEGSSREKPDGSSDLSASPSAATPPSVSAAAPSNENTAEAAAVPPGHYFEVGSFKDQTWADHAVEKLTQLGFNAASVRKNLLWMQSYQVRVGPYADPKDMEAAREVLISQGFKPHPVK